MYNLSPGIVEIDVHGLNKRQAKAAIFAKLRTLNSSVYRLRVIHGYNRGTELREMVRSECGKNPKVKRIEIGLNPGETDLVLREL